MFGQFGVTGDLALQQVESLSGGQKSRVAFAVLCGHSPNFLVLGTLRLHCCTDIPTNFTVLYCASDEPTNHLDIETIEALGHGLSE